MLLFCTAAAAEETADKQDVPVPDRLTVGNTTAMRGEFFTSLWGNATSDIDVRDLLHGYNLVMWDGENGMFREDPSVVKNIVVTDNEEGDRSYTLLLQDDLRYSPICSPFLLKSLRSAERPGAWSSSSDTKHMHPARPRFWKAYTWLTMT